jgi:hypothetical protein
MKRALWILVLAAGLLAGGGAGFAQAPPSLTGAFSVEGLLFELSLFLPGGGGPPGGQQQGGPQQGGQQQGGQQQGGPQRAPFRIERDPALFLASDQVDALLPVMRDLKASPFPTPSRAKAIQAKVDSILTRGQKAAWDKTRKDLEKAQADAQARSGTQSQGQAGGQGGGFRNFSSMTPEQQKELLDRLPEEQRRAFQERMKSMEAEAKLSPAERRARQIDRFIAQLEARRAELKKA